MTKSIIALDCDGVLLDYNLAYANAWARFSGQHPAMRDSEAYWHFHRWSVERLDGEQLAQFRSFFDEEFWSSIPPIVGAIEACHLLHDSGYELICVTAIVGSYAKARLRNLLDHGFPIKKVVATGNVLGQTNPKANVVHQLRPAAFIDDYLPNLFGIQTGIHTALIMREPNGSPNVGPALDAVSSKHANLAGFTDCWLRTNRQHTNASSSSHQS